MIGQQKQEKCHCMQNIFGCFKILAVASVIKLPGHYLHEKVHKICTSSTKRFFFPLRIVSSTVDGKIITVSMFHCS